MQETHARKLPPLKALVVLEATVRHGSVTQASQELHVTQSAVSKQLGVLEDWIGTPLFDKHRQRMIPTAEALRLARAAGEAWDLIADAVADLSETPAERELQVCVPATFAIYWLIPRLWNFSLKHPRVSTRIRTTHTGENWRDIPHDVLIRRDETPPDEMAEVTFLDEPLGLVVAPGALGGRRPRLRDLLAGRLPLLASKTRPHELERWLSAAGIAPKDCTEIHRFAHFYIALEAALAGSGWLVAPLVTVSETLRKRDLVEPWPHLRIAGPRHVASWNPAEPGANDARKLVDWMASTAETCGLADPDPALARAPS